MLRLLLLCDYSPELWRADTTADFHCGFWCRATFSFRGLFESNVFLTLKKAANPRISRSDYAALIYQDTMRRRIEEAEAL